VETKNTQIYGLRSVIEAIDSQETLSKVYLQRGLTGASSYELIKKLKKKSIEISYVPVEKLNRLTPKKSSRSCSYNFTYKILINF